MNDEDILEAIRTYVHEVKEEKTSKFENVNVVIPETIDYIFEKCSAQFPGAILSVDNISFENEEIKREIAINPVIPEIGGDDDDSYDVNFQVLVMIPYLQDGGVNVSMYENLRKFYEVVDFFSTMAVFKYFTLDNITNIQAKDHRSGRGFVYTFEMNVKYSYNLQNLNKCKEATDGRTSKPE